MGFNAGWQVGIEQGKRLQRFNGHAMSLRLSLKPCPYAKNLKLLDKNKIGGKFLIILKKDFPSLNRSALHVNYGHHFLYFISVFSQGIRLPVLGSKAYHFCSTSHDVLLPFSLCSNSHTSLKLAMLWGFKTYTMSPTRGALFGRSCKALLF